MRPPSGASGFDELLSTVRASVDGELEAIWSAALREHAARGPAVARPLEAARSLCMRGGKRLRAALVAVGHRLGGGDGQLESVLEACCAVELLQAYFLIHDDWMDGDRLRRGGPAVHAALEEVFASSHLAAAGAVLAGDYALALATRALGRARPSPERWPEVLECFARMQLDAVIGQKLDVLGDGGQPEEVYRLKTASYTVLGPLQLGLALAPGSGAAALQALPGVAVPLGVAFQLRDDLIGAFADSAVTGKPRGSDLRSGKRTLLVELALARQGLVEESLRRVLGVQQAPAEHIDVALAAIDACGARQDVERRIAALAEEATAAIVAGPWSGDGRALLEGLKRALLERTS